MTERRLPPALEEKVYDSHIWAGDVRDWLYGTETVCPSCGRKWEGNCKDPDCVGGRLGTPGLVERVRMAANQTASRRTGTYVLRPSDVFEALQAELGMEEP